MRTFFPNHVKVKEITFCKNIRKTHTEKQLSQIKVSCYYNTTSSLLFKLARKCGKVENVLSNDFQQQRIGYCTGQDILAGGSHYLLLTRVFHNMSKQRTTFHVSVFKSELSKENSTTALPSQVV